MLGSLPALEASRSKEFISQWILLNQVPIRNIPLIVHSRPGFSMNKLIEWAFHETIEGVKKWYEAGGGIATSYDKLLNHLETVEGRSLHKLVKYDKVTKLTNELRRVDEPLLLTVTPSFLAKEDLWKIVETMEESVFPLLHVYNFLDLSDPRLIELYELILQGDVSVNVPVIFSQQLVPGISKRFMTLGMIGGAVIQSLLPKVNEWEEYLKFKYEGKYDKSTVEFLKLFSPSYNIGEPFKYVLVNLNKENFGIEDPFIAEELQVHEREGKLIEAAPSLGFGNEVIPLPDVWERVVTLPWQLSGLAEEVALHLLGSYPLVRTLARTRKRAAYISSILKGLYERSFNAQLQTIRGMISFIKRDLLNAIEDTVIASALIIRAMDVLYDYAEKYEGIENCGEPCEAIKAYCELYEQFRDAEGLEPVIEELEEVIVELTGMGVEKACERKAL
ncbi:hypothetical protein EYM_05775 [Ignicoccus islandicus DSM 13165]|uniref:Uncharacterized protein n=1 Tax=Ignicoccus islandicus DSM 13165 TaxID=940295 RepID=A0A0U3E3X7_9CREN|nr:hypothetical protein [Ignicoccus islandicus]ALU12619.1 hypothetical protein EYM_05775 [Ignicoccus islandicus DSM 13165]